MKTEGVRLVFTEDGTREIARLAALANKEMENIGARRLHTVMERIVDQVSFEAPDLEDGTEITVDKKFVSERLQDMVVKSDQSKYIL
jgi:ATP-dependent HslUV protease ATP-binding subunit HslU